MTDAQLQEFAKNYRCSHPGCNDWFDMTEDRFVSVARAIEQASRNAALEEAAKLADAWADGRLQDREGGALRGCAISIRALLKSDGGAA